MPGQRIKKNLVIFICFMSEKILYSELVATKIWCTGVSSDNVLPKVYQINSLM